MAMPFGSVTPLANRKRGCCAERRKRSLSCQALKGEPHERARLRKHRGDRDGSKASKPAGTARTQQDPEEATPGVVARHDWVALQGKKTSRERQALEDSVTASGVKL